MVSTLEAMAEFGHEQVSYWLDTKVRLQAIIAVHNTTLGPALGGCRMFPYDSEAAALRDVLRLSRGMTYKAAIAGVDLGGGKSVIIGDPAADKSAELLRSFGRFVGTLHGRYTASEDVGTSMADLEIMRQESAYVSENLTDGVHDMNYLTALGTFEGMRAAAAHALGSGDLAGRTVAVQGLGHVGWPLACMLTEVGARIVVADVRDRLVERAVAELKAVPAAPGDILAQECDILAPCAMGAVLNSETIPALKCRVVAGAANNVLARPEDGAALAGRSILLAPDYVINGGGVIAEAVKLSGGDFADARARVLGVYDNVDKVLAFAESARITPTESADILAEHRLAAADRRNAVTAESPDADSSAQSAIATAR